MEKTTQIALKNRCLLKNQLKITVQIEEFQLLINKEYQKKEYQLLINKKYYIKEYQKLNKTIIQKKGLH